MKTTIHLELEFEVDFDIQKEEKMTRNYPGCPADIEINEIEAEGCLRGINQCLFDKVLAKYQEEIEEVCWEEAFEDHQAYLVEAADHMRDLREDR